MEFKLDDQQKNDIQNYIVNVVKNAVKQGTKTLPPYLNKKEACKYFSVAPDTLTKWASLGMPVANIDGYKLYGIESITNWLKSKEQTKKPSTMQLVKG